MKDNKLKHKSSKGECRLKNQDKIIKFLNETENPYILKVGDMVVKFEYSDVKKTFNECMINILRQKKKMGWHFCLSTLHYKWKGGKINGKKVKVFF